MMIALGTREYLFVFNSNSTKEVWNTLEMIYEIFSYIEHKRMNIHIQEHESSNKSEDHLHK